MHAKGSSEVGYIEHRNCHAWPLCPKWPLWPLSRQEHLCWTRMLNKSNLPVGSLKLSAPFFRGSIRHQPSRNSTSHIIEGKGTQESSTTEHDSEATQSTTAPIGVKSGRPPLKQYLTDIVDADDDGLPANRCQEARLPSAQVSDLSNLQSVLSTLRSVRMSEWGPVEPLDTLKRRKKNSAENEPREDVSFLQGAPRVCPFVRGVHCGANHGISFATPVPPSTLIVIPNQK